MRITDRFSREHEAFLAQLAALESLLASDADLADVAQAFAAFAAPLLRHAGDEERALFPALEPSFGWEAGPLTVLTIEHHVLHGQIDDVARARTRAEIANVLGAFAPLLRAHIEKEESVLFPAAVALLGDARLDELEAATAEPAKRP